MSSIKAMQEISVEELMCNYNLIVPEIQREYVWGFNDNGILDTFILDIKEGYKKNKDTSNFPKSELEAIKKLILNSNDVIAKNSLNKIINNINNTSDPLNIGFLYSYRPDYYVFNDINEDLYLIDGQQRFTTLFLILFYLSLKEGKQDDFITLFRFDRTIERIAFDYRVRTLTHNFFIDLISYSNTVEDLLNIRYKNWFLSNYDNDVTVNAIVGQKSKENSGVFKKLDLHFKNDTIEYYDFIKTQIKFWHFKTEETSQGEELYITMNSRGQQLADNETIRARLFDNEEVKKNPLEWSEKWEIWQDFFWKNRNKNTIEITADEGFNEFLRWIQIIKMTENQKTIIDDDNEEAVDKKAIIDVIKWGNGKKLDINFLQLQEIEIYFNALKFLYEDFPKELDSVKLKYNSYKNFNLIEKEWLSPTSNNNNIEQIDCFRLLPILYYIKIRQSNNNKPDSLKLFRIIRFFYNLKRDRNIGKAASIQCINGLKLISKLDTNSEIEDILEIKGISSTILNAEERLKLQILKSSTNRFKAEDLFWLAEDIDQNDGEIAHLINLTKSNNIDKFDLVLFEEYLNIFIELIDNENEIWGNLINTDVYVESGDRIKYIEDWHKSKGFLNLLLSRHHSSKIILKDFLRNAQKIFIKYYKSIDELREESSFKNQIYIYFIIQNNIYQDLKLDFWWAGWNVGAYSKYSGYNSIFAKSYIYQNFDSQFRENQTKILWIHSQKKDKNMLIEELLLWSKQN
ncbi:MAG: DUF262 domain-containing protein [Flavobacteriales bacterium]|nr:DUF262 domain-containing protein [Flavobacteriales bacterium]